MPPSPPPVPLLKPPSPPPKLLHQPLLHRKHRLPILLLRQLNRIPHRRRLVIRWNDEERGPAHDLAGRRDGFDDVGGVGGVRVLLCEATGQAEFLGGGIWVGEAGPEVHLRGVDEDVCEGWDVGEGCGEDLVESWVSGCLLGDRRCGHDGESVKMQKDETFRMAKSIVRLERWRGATIFLRATVFAIVNES